MRLCNVDNCENKHEAKGFCKRHYKSYIRYGDPLQVDKNEKLRIENKKKKAKTKTSKSTRKIMSRDGVCSVKGCSSHIKARGLCEMHYARNLRTGSTGSVSPVKGNVETCLVIGCSRKHSAHGYCNTHVKYYRETGSPYLPKIIKLCGVSGCNEKHWGKGMCKEHFDEWRKTLRKHGLYK